MIAFGMNPTLIYFQDKDYMYKGVVEEIPDKDKDKNELAFGLYEAALCSDLCTIYIFEMMTKQK